MPVRNRSKLGAALLGLSLALTGCTPPESESGDQKLSSDSGDVHLGTDKQGVEWWLALQVVDGTGMAPKTQGTDAATLKASNHVLLAKDGKKIPDDARTIPIDGFAVEFGVAACVGNEWHFSPYVARGRFDLLTAVKWETEKWDLDPKNAEVDTDICPLPKAKALAASATGDFGFD